MTTSERAARDERLPFLKEVFSSRAVVGETCRSGQALAVRVAEVAPQPPQPV